MIIQSEGNMWAKENRCLADINICFSDCIHSNELMEKMNLVEADKTWHMFPEIRFSLEDKEETDENKLGLFTVDNVVKIINDNNIWFFYCNAYCQYGDNVDYISMMKSLRSIINYFESTFVENHKFSYSISKKNIPAGYDWKLVEQIINRIFDKHIVYLFD